ncbi:hypothetical protein [Accumulibacter sp.]|uniref:hypothetical protein n=1 Tax=Accumulibacter sp. TaxID=2053492 RepID=UPI002BF71494|nr:hypothetical protein [Accumulibacter sp.]HRF06008.1 hypothetical protein [Accumulibacter sp.]
MPGRLRADRGNVDYLLTGIKATPLTREDTTIAQVEASLKPELLKGYYQSKGRENAATLGVFVSDMRKRAKSEPGPFLLQNRAAPAKQDVGKSAPGGIQAS